MDHLAFGRPFPQFAGNHSELSVVYVAHVVDDHVIIMSLACHWSINKFDWDYPVYIKFYYSIVKLILSWRLCVWHIKSRIMSYIKFIWD